MTVFGNNLTAATTFDADQLEGYANKVNKIIPLIKASIDKFVKEYNKEFK